MKTLSATSSDGRNILVYQWLSNDARANIHLMHGMAEHISRYNDFADYLSQQGYNVYAHNHRGHGPNEIAGHYADDEGWNKIIKDIVDVQDQCIEHQNLPLVLFGHSMGSFIAQGYAIRHSDRLAGLILSGSNYQAPFIYHAGRIVAKIEKKRLGVDKPSNVMDTLSFSSFNNHFKPARTDFDWLSRDEEQVDQYIGDDGCGFPCSGETWTQLFNGLIEISNTNNLRKIKPKLPIYLFGGDKDPVGRMGKGLPALAKQLMKSGHDNVTVQLYKDGRHEMLNETNRAQVFSEVTSWLSQKI